MKKMANVFLLTTLMLFAFSPANASIVWIDQANSTYSYTLENNGGSFLHPEAQPNPNSPHDHNWTNDIPGTIEVNSIDTIASDSRQENFYSKGGSADLQVTSSGGIAGNSSMNYVMSSFDFVGQTGGPGRFEEGENGISINQNFSSKIQRKFIVDGDTKIRLDSSLDGVIDFDEFDNGSSEAFLEELKAPIYLIEFIEGSASMQTVYHFYLDKDKRTDSMEIDLFPEIDGKDVFYLFSTAINVKAHMSNIKGSFGPYYDDDGKIVDFGPIYTGLEFEGTFNIGETGSPLALTTELIELTEFVPTPIPGSLFLFLSGLGGLNLFRRRFRVKP